MIDPAIISALVAAAQALAAPLFDAFLGALGDDARDAVLEALARDDAALAATPSSRADMLALLARHRILVRAHTQARAETVRDRFHLTDTTQQALSLAAAGQPLTHELRTELGIGARFLAAALRGEVAPTVPRVLDVPAGAWSETGRVDD